jgi:hypothetical protein
MLHCTHNGVKKAVEDPEETAQGRPCLRNSAAVCILPSLSLVKKSALQNHFVVRRRGWTGDATFTNCVMNTKIWFKKFFFNRTIFKKFLAKNF